MDGNHQSYTGRHSIVVKLLHGSAEQWLVCAADCPPSFLFVLLVQTQGEV